MKTCTHLDQVRDVTPGTPNGCEECLKTGDTWVHLRLCLECGHVGCCDSSKNKHATKHFHRMKHPIMKSFERGENWGCATSMKSSSTFLRWRLARRGLVARNKRVALMDVARRGHLRSLRFCTGT